MAAELGRSGPRSWPREHGIFCRYKARGCGRKNSLLVEALRLLVGEPSPRPLRFDGGRELLDKRNGPGRERCS
jgi:hypothetical protein